jgi:hypothetical protein
MLVFLLFLLSVLLVVCCYNLSPLPLFSTSVTPKVVFVIGALYPSTHRLAGICGMKLGEDHFDPPVVLSKKRFPRNDSLE